jgi:hypothetical protein
MSPVAALDRQDRRMLLIVLGLVAALIVVLGFLSPAADPDKNTVPDSYLTGQHGAKAAYTLLQRSGYNLQRWEQPLSTLAAHADAQTVLILAEPYTFDDDDSNAIRGILTKGGRVVATGAQGGLLLPYSGITEAKGLGFVACEAQPEGLSPLAAPGSIWLVPRVAWKLRLPQVRAAYTCAGQPVVVEYPAAQGHVVWWASATPLENGSIQRGQNLELLLNSVGPAAGHRIYWDESLHGQSHSPWEYTSGPVLPLLLAGSATLMLLIVLSFSRRSGPIRPLPAAPRTTPIEFLDALGGLYRATGANATVLQIAWERFRSQAALLTGQRTHQLDAAELAAAIERRYGAVIATMKDDLIAAEAACWDEKLKPRQALKLVQALRRHEETLRHASSQTRPAA